MCDAVAVVVVVVVVDGVVECWCWWGGSVIWDINTSEPLDPPRPGNGNMNQ